MEKFKLVSFTFGLIACLATISCKPIEKRSFPLEVHLPQVPVVPTEFGILPPVVSNAIVDLPANTGPIAVKTNDECLELKANLPTTHVHHPIITHPAPPPPLPHLEPLPVPIAPHHASIFTHEQGLTHNTVVEQVQHPIITPPAPPPPLPHLEPLPVPVAPHHASIFTHEQGLAHNTVVEQVQHPIITPPAPPPPLPHLEPLPVPIAPHHASIFTHEQGLTHNTVVQHVEHPIITPHAQSPPLPHLEPLPIPAIPHTPTSTVVHNDCPEGTIVESVEYPIITPPAPPPPLPLLNPVPIQTLTPTITHEPTVVTDDCGEIKTIPAAAPPKLPILSSLPPAAPQPIIPVPTPTHIAPQLHPANVPIAQDDCITDDTIEILPASPAEPSPHDTFVETGPTAHGFEVNAEPPTHIIHPPPPPPALPLHELKIVAAPVNFVSQPIALPHAHVTPVEPIKNVNLENVSITGIGPAPVPSAPSPSQSECVDLSSIFDWETLVRQNGGLHPTIPNIVKK